MVRVSTTNETVGFYTELQPILDEVGVLTPKCYYSFLEDDGDCSALAAIVAGIPLLIFQLIE